MEKCGMIYLFRAVVILIIIAAVSGAFGHIIKKKTKKRYLGLLSGIIIFVIIVFAPITIAKVVAVYYCNKYQPLEQIVKPLGDDFHGYYQDTYTHALDNFISITRKYPDIIDFLDFNLDKKLYGKDGFGRYSLLKYGSPQCLTSVLPNQFISQIQFDEFQLQYAKAGLCIAFKELAESKVSEYFLESKRIEDKIIFAIPGMVRARYGKSSLFRNRITGETFAWVAGINVKWDLYFAFIWWGNKFGCSGKIDLKDDIIKGDGGRNNGD